ncbi:MAG: flavin reductase family protein [Nitrososphaerales archaeon]
MSRKTPSKSERYFTTGLAMITSRGNNGPDVMAAEWVMQISYHPVLIGAFIHEGSQTLKNIERTKEFGINVASQDQTTGVNIAGGYSGTELDKLKIKSIFKLIKPQKIKTPLIADCTINAECKLVKKQKLGDHVMIVGKVVNIRHDDSKRPLMYHKGRYFGLGSAIEQDRVKVNVHKDMLEFFKNIAREKFVVKCVGVVVESKKKILVIQGSKTALEMIPFSIPSPGINQRDHLIKFLKHMKLELRVEDIPIMKRLILKNGKNIQRVNFVLFKGTIQKSAKITKWKSPTDNSLISSLI